MAIAKDYFAAACPEPWQILGVKLKPFSLGHYIKLHRLGCAFVSEIDTEAGLQDLVMAVVVCSMSSDADQDEDQFWTWLNRRTGGLRYRLYRLKQKLFGKSIATPAEFDVYRWGKRVGEVDVAEKVKMFSQYMELCSAMPAYVEETKTGAKESYAHWAQSVLHALVSKCGYSINEAMNAPMSRAMADFIKQAEVDGVVRILPSEAVQ